MLCNMRQGSGYSDMNTLPKISLATLDGDIVHSDNAVKFEMARGCTLTTRCTNLTCNTIWYIKYGNIFHKIWMRKYPQICFQLSNVQLFTQFRRMKMQVMLISCYIADTSFYRHDLDSSMPVLDSLRPNDAYTRR